MLDIDTTNMTPADEAMLTPGNWFSVMHQDQILFTGQLVERDGHVVTLCDVTGQQRFVCGVMQLAEADPTDIARVLSVTMVPMKPIDMPKGGDWSLAEAVFEYGPPATFKRLLKGNVFTNHWHLAVTTDDRYFWFNDDGEVCPT